MDRLGFLALFLVFPVAPAPLPALQSSTGQNGVIAEYYENPTTSAASPPRYIGWPDYPGDPVMPKDASATELFTRVEQAINFNWLAVAPPPEGTIMVPADDYMVVFRGFIKAPQTGTYTFRVRSDDGRRLWVNDRLILNTWTDTTGFFSATTVNLDQDGVYPFRLEFYENGGSAYCELYWQLPGSTLDTLVPENAYFQERPPPPLPPGAVPPGGGGNANADDSVNDRCTSSIGAGSPAEALRWGLLAILAVGLPRRRRR